MIPVFCAFALVLAACTGTQDAAVPENPDVEPEPELLERAERDETPGEGVSEEVPVSNLEPTSPSGLTVLSTADGTIELEWEASREDGVSLYRVLRTASGSRPQQFDVEATTFSDTGLDDGDIFSYRVVAIRGSEESEPSETVIAQVGIDTNPPQRPGQPEIVETAAAQSLTWTGTRDVSGIDRYVLNREVDGVVTELDAGPEIAFEDDLPAGTIATYSVVAVDGAGNASEASRSTTLLTGTPSDRLVVVVSAQADAGDNEDTARLERELLENGYRISWFEDGVFDSNNTTSEDLILLLGDIEGQGFDWNVFFTDATVVGLKAPFVQAAGFIAEPPKLDRVAQLTYVSPENGSRVVSHTTINEPRPVTFLLPAEQVEDLQVFALPAWSDVLAIGGIIPQGGELATGDPAIGCRAFFPGNIDSLAETSTAGYEVLLEFVSDVANTCGA